MTRRASSRKFYTKLGLSDPSFCRPPLVVLNYVMSHPFSSVNRPVRVQVKGMNDIKGACQRFRGEKKGCLEKHQHTPLQPPPPADDDDDDANLRSAQDGEQ
jgi:hypothetical protein